MNHPELSIAVLLPDVLGTYSDTGNAVVLAHRARRRGIPADIVAVGADTEPPTGCELYLLGGGEDTAQQFAVGWLHHHPALIDTLGHRATTLAVCAGLQILGRSTTDTDGRPHPGVGLLDLTTAPRRRRAVGEVLTRCELPGVGLLTGFENHRGATTLGPTCAPLGRVLTGVGNGAARHAAGRRVDGAVTDRIVATYLHGPVLARNPALADHLLHRATGQTLPELDLPDQSRLRATYLPAPHRRPIPFLPRLGPRR